MHAISIGSYYTIEMFMITQSTLLKLSAVQNKIFLSQELIQEIRNSEKKPVYGMYRLFVSLVHGNNLKHINLLDQLQV